jgi:hypothetical protein
MRPVVAGLCLWLAAALCPAAAATGAGWCASEPARQIEHEANHGIGNDHYTVAMARVLAPDTN